MDAQRVDMYLMTKAKYFEGHQIPLIRERLLALDESRFLQLQALNLKDPTTILIVSLVAGTFAVDRFLVGDTGLGIAKLLTCGGLGIWAIVDWFIIMGRAREVNAEQFFTSVA
jgi:TM2 domain-containing membrane protein YozV